jgi:hypothetical protein
MIKSGDLVTHHAVAQPLHVLSIDGCHACCMAPSNNGWPFPTLLNFLVDELKQSPSPVAKNKGRHDDYEEAPF